MIFLYGISAQIVIILPRNLRQDDFSFPAAASVSLKHTQVAIMNLRHHRIPLGMNHKHILIRLKATRRYINPPLHAILSQSATTLKNAAAQLEDVVTLYVEVVGEGKLIYGEVTDQKIAISAQKSDSKVYDLLGRSTTKSGKGLRIINGKKVIF